MGKKKSLVVHTLVSLLYFSFKKRIWKKKKKWLDLWKSKNSTCYQSRSQRTIIIKSCSWFVYEAYLTQRKGHEAPLSLRPVNEQKGKNHKKKY